jgi:hypothetical protein
VSLGFIPPYNSSPSSRLSCWPNRSNFLKTLDNHVIIEHISYHKGSRLFLCSLLLAGVPYIQPDSFLFVCKYESLGRFLPNHHRFLVFDLFLFVSIVIETMEPSNHHSPGTNHYSPYTTLRFVFDSFQQLSKPCFIAVHMMGSK